MATTAPPKIQPCRYKVGKTLGAGSYSVVKECLHIDTGRCYAAKVINKRLMAGREHMVRNEIAVLKKVSMGHKNILTLVDYFETMNNLYLVTDLALGGELFDRICRKGSYYESDAADLIRSTLSAVAYLHDHGIVHRDLKPENLLFRTPEDNADLLIADFGLSRIMDEEQFHVLTTTCGTPGYMAPEIFKKTGHGKPVDIWALGVITYFLLCGYTPFDRDSDFDEMQAILKADYSFTPVDYWRGVSDDAKDFVRRCLTIDPARRMTAHEALQHRFVAGYEANAAGVVHKGENLLPNVKKNFNARRTLHAAIDTVRAINKLREGQNSNNASPNANSNNSHSHSHSHSNSSNINANTNSNTNNARANYNGNGNSAAYSQQPPAAAPIPVSAPILTPAVPVSAPIPAPVAPSPIHPPVQVPAYDAVPPPVSSAPVVSPMGSPSSGNSGASAHKIDSGYATGQSGNTFASNNGADVSMGEAPPLNDVPMSLRPGMEVNKVIETSKGLWMGVGSRR